MFKQKQDEEMASCPFNKAHIFAREKLIFHLNRCKDRQKVAHLFATCRYNGMHFIKKEEAEMHELLCPNKEEVRKMMATMRNNFLAISRERERSRDKAKCEQEQERAQKVQEEEEEEDATLSDCEECQKLLQNLNLDDHPKLKKYLRKYESLSAVKLEGV